MTGGAGCKRLLLGVAAVSVLGCACESRKRATQTEPAPHSAPEPSTVAVTPAPRPSNPSSAQARANGFFLRTCAVCHGREGLGNGPGAGGLDVPPRNYTDAEWQASVSDEHIKRTIVGGGTAVGKDAAMPAHPQLATQPEVLDALVVKIRAFNTAQ
jgi:mono/diheme cytochrome c family protein